MRRFEPKLLLEQSEQNFIYGGIALTLFVEFFVLIMIYLNQLSRVFIIPIALTNITIGYVLFDRAFKGRKKLEKIKQIELIREVLAEKKKK